MRRSRPSTSDLGTRSIPRTDYAVTDGEKRGKWKLRIADCGLPDCRLKDSQSAIRNPQSAIDLGLMGSSDQLGRVQSHGEEHRIIGKAQAAAIAYLEASIRKRQEIEPDRNAVVFNIRGRSLPDNHALGFKRAFFRLPATSAVTATVPCACRRVRVSMADQLAVHLLVTARHNHVGRGAESYQRGHPIGGAAFELAGKSQRREWAGEE